MTELIIILVVVGIAITIGVYGVVALIVKMDDVGLHLHQNASTSGGRSFGAGLVKAMPHVLRVVTVIGTVAMLWVGGHIVLVELDALAGEPMDVLVNGYLIAQGEVVVVNDKFGIRLTDVVTPSERLRRVSRG